MEAALDHFQRVSVGVRLAFTERYVGCWHRHAICRKWLACFHLQAAEKVGEGPSPVATSSMLTKGLCLDLLAFLTAGSYSCVRSLGPSVIFLALTAACTPSRDGSVHPLKGLGPTIVFLVFCRRLGCAHLQSGSTRQRAADARGAIRGGATCKKEGQLVGRDSLGGVDLYKRN